MHEGAVGQVTAPGDGGRCRVPWRHAACTLVGLSLLLPLSGCTSDGRPTPSAPAGAAAASLTAGELRTRLLDPEEMGDDVRRPTPDASPSSSASAAPSLTSAVKDCDARAQYGGRIPVKELMGTARAASAGYLGPKELLTQHLYSAEPATLMSRTQALFTTLNACRRFTEVLTVDGGSAELDVTTRKAEVPGMSGLTYGCTETKAQTDVPGSEATTTKVVAVLRGRVAVILMGTPAMVDRVLERAVKKATG
uniref:PknH-like extracellular domain-containing protein n=1 Tax=Streptomyces sp. NBC_01401 TaxID=2903854 RepID=A0AAU3GQR3_9ACTN